MWNQTTESELLALREDAVLLIRTQDMTVIHENPAAVSVFGDIVGKTYAELISSAAVDHLVRTTLTGGKLAGCTLDEQPWFDCPAVIHTVMAPWGDEEVLVISIDRRAYGPPPEALQLMKAVLTASYFTAFRVDMQTLRTSVMISNRAILSTQPNFRSYPDFIRIYAEAVIHPEDREEFLSSLSAEQLHLFIEAGTVPSCTVRRLQDEEYRWASFTLATVNSNIVLLLGKDSNEQHLQQERSDRYLNELETLSSRNAFILSGVTDIFRLMLHIDLRTGDTVVCSMNPSFARLLSYDIVYPYEEIYRTLLELTAPEDQPMLQRFSDFTQFPALIADTENKIAFEYRRISKSDSEPRWTRSVINLVSFADGKPTEAVYTVQDIDAQRRKEIAQQRREESVTSQFYTLIQNRYLWFIEYDFASRTAHSYQIMNHSIMPQTDIPFGQFFERLIMPTCHPEDFKRVARVLLPAAAKEAIQAGNEQVTLEFRLKSDGTWKYVRAEMYFRKDDLNEHHAMLYISDIDREVQQNAYTVKAEHKQLELRRRFGLTVQDSYVRIGEIDLDADRISHYRLDADDFVVTADPVPFSKLSEAFPQHNVHPEQRETFKKLFSYQQLLRANRERTEKIKQLFLIDLNETGQYRWCNLVVQFFHDRTGKPYLMTYIEDVNDEICKRDAQLHALEQRSRSLMRSFRNTEQIRIRKAHLFFNFASNFQLALNRIYSSLEQLRSALPEDVRKLPQLTELSSVYEQLSGMTKNAKDILLLENNMLPLLSEPVRLPQMIRRIRQNAEVLFENKQLAIMAFTRNVMHETVLTDSRRLTDLIENIFIRVIRALPDQTGLTLQLSEAAINDRPETSMYEFSLISYGNTASQSMQRGLCEPLPEGDDTLSEITAIFSPKEKDQQHSLYVSKRIISMMNGDLSFVRLPDHASAVILRIPFSYQENPVIFPHLHWFRKRVIVCDSQQQYAASTMELLRETGMQLEWQPDFENLLTCLHAAEVQKQPYSLILLRQSDLNAVQRDYFTDLQTHAPGIPVLILLDGVPAPHAVIPADAKEIFTAETPLFRSVLSDALWQIAETDKPHT